MVVYEKNIDGYEVKIETTRLYDEGEPLGEDDDPAANISVKGKGKSIKAPIWAPLPKEFTDEMVRRFLEAEELK